MRLTSILPLLVFAGLAGAFLVMLGSGGGSRPLPSALIGKPVPAFDIPAMTGRPEAALPEDESGLTAASLADGRVKLVNFWASWCAPCRVEHPVLMQIAEEGLVDLHGVNYKDAPEAALRFLRLLGDPFDRIGVDASGRVGIDWGVYGVPETYVIDGEGKVVMRHVGPITEEAWRQDLLPRIEVLKGEEPRPAS